jgi:hypothetical protein
MEVLPSTSGAPATRAPTANAPLARINPRVPEEPGDPSSDMEDIPVIELTGRGEFLSSGESTPGHGAPNSPIPRDHRDIPADHLTLRDFDGGHYTVSGPPGNSTDEDDEVMDDMLERRTPPPWLRELSDFQTTMSDMFGRFQRCYNNERDLVRIISTRERRCCDDLQRAQDENSYILARQENLLHRIRELTLERDEARHNVAAQTDELPHLRQEVCMHNATIIELKQKLATAERQVPTERADASSTALDRTRPQCPPKDRHLALLAYVEALTVSRAIAFSELARVRQEMGRLSYMHRTCIAPTLAPWDADVTITKPSVRRSGI